MKNIDVNSQGLFDLDCSFIPESLKQKALKCMKLQKQVAQQQHDYQPCDTALEQVSEAALTQILAANIDVHGISTQREISNVICFGASNIDDAIHHDLIRTLRQEVDREISACISEIFAQSNAAKLVSSGHFWYPEQSFMGWHTNSQSPGWRIYINYAEQENQSFFRFQDHSSGEIRTLWDHEWNLRVFRITQGQPLWHCVYSNTNRFSLGYMLKMAKPRSLVTKLFDLIR
jgi:hypothetical protein